VALEADGKARATERGHHVPVFKGQAGRNAKPAARPTFLSGATGTPVAVRIHEVAATVFLFQNHLGSTVAAYNDTTNTAI
jgi:hypothetical protein